MRIFKRLALVALIGLACLVVLGIIAGGVTYWLIEPRVPSVASLKNVQMQVPLRVLSADGKLIAEFGETRRMPVQIENVPAYLKNAVLAAEDADFYHHSGIDVTSTLRAAFEVVLHHGEKVQGGSTITQQVARNFFLSPQKTYTRKLTEMLTAFRIENELPKDQILQLYLNKMFLGHRSYGVAAAAQYYYGKTIDQLTLAQCAAIASSFQSPSVVNPIDHKPRLIARRNWVLGQMLTHRFINQAEYDQAIAAPDDATPHEPPVEVDAPYLAEMVRQQALQKLGNQAQTDGYVIRTTLDSRLQALANHALRSKLEEYDHRHGYRGPEAHVALPQPATPAALQKALSRYNDVSGLYPAIVTAAGEDDAEVYVQGGETIKLSIADMKWAMGFARKAKTGGKGAASILRPGDIIRVREVADAEASTTAPAKPAKDEKIAAADKKHWELQQIPAAQSAMVVLSPNDGSVKALVGGFNFQLSKFNRAVDTAPAGLQLQALHLFGGFQSRLHAGLDHQRRADRPARSLQAGRAVDTTERRQQVPRTDAAARRTGAIGEPRGNPFAGCSRRALRARIRDTLRFPAGCDPGQPLDGPWHRIRFADGNGPRLCGIRQWRLPDQPLLHRRDRRPQWQGHLQGRSAAGLPHLRSAAAGRRQDHRSADATRGRGRRSGRDDRHRECTDAGRIEQAVARPARGRSAQRLPDGFADAKRDLRRRYRRRGRKTTRSRRSRRQDRFHQRPP